MTADNVGRRRQGQVVAAFGRRFVVAAEGGGEFDCVTRGKRHDIVCGDGVDFTETSPGAGVIDRVAPRAALFYRSDAWREKRIAANVTQVVVVVAAKPAFSEDLVNRCIAAAEAGGTRALIAFNKIDLPEADGAREKIAVYRVLGYRVIALSAKRDLAPLREALTGELSVLVGQSGMGKSTMINGLVPDAAARVAEVSAALGAGRHTTTSARLYRLDAVSAIIDSPGIQEFGLHHLSIADAAQAFVEFRPLLGSCRFRDCRHLTEPDCAIVEAAARGEIAAQRLASYQRLAAGVLRGANPASGQR